jgi:hypothetical protein
MSDPSPEILIERFQCPGCAFGTAPKECLKFRLRADQGDAGFFSCEGHRPGTFLAGAGRLCLGLPKGFCRCGPGEFQVPFIRFFRKPPAWDRFNVPVWALERDGVLFVRTFLPRLNVAFVDVIVDGKIGDVPGALDVSTFQDDMD